MQRRNLYALLLSLVFVSLQLLGCGGGKKIPVTISNSVPATGTVGVGYLGTLTATGGSGTYMWTVGGLPAGVMASGTTTATLTISGTPTMAGTSPFTATVTDSKGHTANFSVSIVISAATPAITITGSLPATGTVGTMYSGSLTASGGTAPYMWVVTGLPTGVTPSGAQTATVTASGTPTTAGTFAVSATVTDANTNTATFTVSVVISAAAANLSVRLPAGYPLTATVGTAYSAPALVVSGGTPPYAFTVAQGSVPGLTISPTTGAITGTPTTAGTFKPTVKVTDSATPANTGFNNFTVVVSGSGGSTITISPSTLGTLINGTAVTPIALTATATTAPYNWTVTSGALPAGLVLNNGTTTNTTTITSTTNSITITGTPTTTGAYSFTLSITDSATPVGSGSQAFSGTVNAAAATACAPTPALRGNESALTLPYAFLLKGDDVNDLPVAWAGSFTPNGSGGITAADVDFVGTVAGPESLQVQLAGSSYSYGSDGRGCLYLAFSGLNGASRRETGKVGNPNLGHGKARRQVRVHPAALANTGTVVFSFALSPAFETGRITEFDYVNSLLVAAGQMHQQTAADFALSKLSSNFAFGFDGWLTDDAEGDVERTAIAGSFANAAGVVSNLTADDNVGGLPDGPLNGSGTLTVTPVSTTTGRGAGSYTITTTNGPLTFDFAYYIVNGSDIYILSSDDPNTVGNFILSGRALKSAATSVALNGFYMAAISGIDLSSGDGVGNNTVTIASFQATSAGAIPTATVSANDGGTFQTQSFTDGTYTLDTSTGRVAIAGVGSTPVAYLTATAGEDDIAAFVVGTDAAASSGFLALQGTSAPNLTNASLSGGYAFGSAEDVVGISGSVVGTFTLDGKGNYTNLLDAVSVGEIASQPDQAGSGTFTVNMNGSGNFDNGNHVFVTNDGGTLILAIDGPANGTTQPLLYIFIEQVAP
jgi:hypothetical protein